MNQQNIVPRRRKFLLSVNLAKSVGFRRQNVFGRNRVTQRGCNPIYELAAEKCGLTVHDIHTEVSQRIAPASSANCFWLWWSARRALAQRERESARLARETRRREDSKHWPSRQRTDAKRFGARDRYQKNIMAERTRARRKMALRRSVLRITASFEAKVARASRLQLKGQN
jgi:hypothetical protein